LPFSAIILKVLSEMNRAMEISISQRFAAQTLELHRLPCEIRPPLLAIVPFVHLLPLRLVMQVVFLRQTADDQL
jgi:hypothetical protein